MNNKQLRRLIKIVNNDNIKIIAIKKLCDDYQLMVSETKKYQTQRITLKQDGTKKITPIHQFPKGVDND